MPFQYNANLNFGPDKATQSILNIQPVIPISVDKDWNVITRTIARPDFGANWQIRAQAQVMFPK